MTTKILALFALLGVVGLGTGNAVSAEESKKGKVWKCVAEDIENFSYDGGSTAMIHLGSYSEGGDYDVTLNADKTVGEGVTGDGTPFTCTLVPKK